MSGVKIAVVGANGRMGRMIIESTLKDGEASLVAAIDQPGTPAIGKDAGELVGMPCGVQVSTDLKNWSDGLGVSQQTGGGGIQSYTDAQAVGGEARFYRNKVETP